MSVNVSPQTILDALHHVPQDRWGDVLAFIESLRSVGEPVRDTGPRPLTAADLLASGLVGIWSDRTDIGDSREFARRLREQAQTRSRG
jgi:hypothetical protein